MVTQTPSGTNWVKNLPNYMKCLNNEKREKRGWQSPFKTCFGRKSNKLVGCGLPEKEVPQKLERFRDQQRMMLIDLKNYARKQGKEHLIPTKGLQKEQENIFRKKE